MKQPRRNHSSTLKAKVALAAIEGDQTPAQLSERSDVHPQQITQWKAQLLEKTSDPCPIMYTLMERPCPARRVNHSSTSQANTQAVSGMLTPRAAETANSPRVPRSDAPKALD